MSILWEKFVCNFFKFAPSLVVCLNFLPAGLIFGYTICSFVAERNANQELMEYGPLIVGACWGFVTALTMFAIKFFYGRVMFWHIHILLVGGVFNLIASCFYFANGFDHIGAFISYVAHSLTFLASFSFLHSITSKASRAILLSTSCSFYLLGVASAVSLIGSSYSDNLSKNDSNVNHTESIDGLYVDFAATYLSISAVMLAVLIGLKVLNYLGTVDTENSMDNEFRIANSNSNLFAKRAEVIKRIQFFYVTKNQQWNVTFLLLFAEAVQYALFIYFVFWFSVNGAMRLTEIGNIGLMFWTIFGGSVLATICLIFISAKVNFVANQLILIILTLLSLIICSSIQTTVPFWLIFVIFGTSFSSLQIVLIEVANFRFTEVVIFISYLLKLLSTSIVAYYFVSDPKNSYFYSEDSSTLMAQGFVFIIISALLALVVGMKVPRTHRMPLMDIQYSVYGIIFMKHQIEQLNVRWLSDGTIPTINGPEVA